MVSKTEEPSEIPATPTGQSEHDMMQDLRTGGCPICNHVGKVMFDFLANWQCELKNDEMVQQEFAVERGLCSAHTWLFADMASPRSLSKGYPILLEHIAEELLRLLDTSCNFSDAIKALVKEPENCRVCRLLRDSEEIYARQLAVFLEREDTHTACKHSRVICLRHLSLLFSFLNHKEFMRILLLEKAKYLRKTAEEMKSYTKKDDALERKLITRNEQHSYLRALLQVAGSRNVFAPQFKRIA